jgi:deoxyribodipyrimidine photolyase-related protein
MTEAQPEAEHVWSSKPRIVMFLSAMRHFREVLRRRRIDVCYSQVDERGGAGTLSESLERCVREHRPGKIIVVQPGEHRVLAALRKTARQMDVELEVRPDRSFLCTLEEFEEYARTRKQLRMEFFYRQIRRRLDVLMDSDEPAGGRWNLDSENRGSFTAAGPPDGIEPRSFAPDQITCEVIAAVNRAFPKHPGRLDQFDWPVTGRQASAALKDFLDARLKGFGDFQDAMWIGRPFLFHSRLSAAMNLKLLDPRGVIVAVEEAYREGRVPLNAAEGFIRQVLGWREYVRGVYWRFMPGYLEMNALNARSELPAFYWTGETGAVCLREVINQTLRLGYAHHIERLMVTGLFALLLGVEPREVHKWYLAVYVDAVEWVELPNTLGMSQFADGGIMASKPYSASGNYIKRMSNYCQNCRFDPARSTGESACPFTTLYWDFLISHEKSLASNARMALQLRNLARLGRQERKDIRAESTEIRNACAAARR